MRSSIKITLNDKYIIFDARENYKSTFIRTNLPKATIEELFPLIKISKVGNYYFPFIIDRIYKKSVDIICGSTKDGKITKYCKANFAIAIVGHTSMKQVTFTCNPITIDGTN